MLAQIVGMKGGDIMFTEEMAREIGIVYGNHKAFCAVIGKTPISPDEFKKMCCDGIEEIRKSAGLVEENSFTG